MRRGTNARLMRIALPVLLVVAALAGLGVRLTHHTGAPSSAPPGSRYAGTLTLVVPGGWLTPGWPITGGLYPGDLWDFLLDYKPDGSFFPELAAQVPSLTNGGLRVVNGNEVITFHLKPNLRWSDGSAITAADYIAALVVGSAPEIQTFAPASQTPCPLHAAQVSGSTLVITLAGILPEALEYCDFTPGPWEYLQRKYGLTVPASLTTSFDAERMVAMFVARSYQGSPLQRLIVKLTNDPYTLPGDLFNGPYRMTSWSKGGAGVEEPNPYFTALPPDPHHPRPARIRLVTLPGDAAASARAIVNGAIPANIDVALVATGLTDLAPPPALHAHPPFQLMMQPLREPDHLELNQDNPALRDRRVRQALLYAVDKIAYLRRLFNLSAPQAAAIADTSPFAHLMRFSIADQLPTNLYNPAKARALLAAAGYAASPNGPGRRLRLDLYTTTRPGRERSAEILQRMWRQIGVTVTLHFSNLNGSGGLYNSYDNGGILARGAFDITEFAWTANRDDGLDYYEFLDPGQVPDQNHPNGANYARVRDRTLFSLLSQAQHTLDDARRRQLYAQFQRYMVDQVYWIPLYDVPFPVLVRPTIGAFNPNGGAVVVANLFWNTYEWYVK